MTPPDYIATAATFALLIWLWPRWEPYFPLRRRKR